MNRFTGNSTELGGVVRESFVRSAWFPVAVNCIMECTPLHGSHLSQSDSVELVLPETRLNEQTNERFANDSRELGHGKKSLNPPLMETANELNDFYLRFYCDANGVLEECNSVLSSVTCDELQ